MIDRKTLQMLGFWTGYATAGASGCTRRACFSTPAVIYNRLATGVAESADNHRTGNATGPLSAAFRVSNLILRAGFASTPWAAVPVGGREAAQWAIRPGTRP